MTFDLTDDQDKALTLLSRFLEKPDGGVFQINGYAGTGKTWLATNEVPKLVGGNGLVHFVALTGKAVDVLAKKGAKSASTVHSLLYTPSSEYGWCSDCSVPMFDVAGTDAHHVEAKHRWSYKTNFEVGTTWNGSVPELVVVDEASMIGEDTAADLLNLTYSGTKLLVLGDPAQLPPLFGNGSLLRRPDVTLRQITRQAADSPIIQLATSIREGRGMWGTGTYGDESTGKVWINPRKRPEGPMRVSLVGRHVTRYQINTAARKHLGLDPDMPVIGDKLICRRNNKDLGIYNGQPFEVVGDVRRINEDMFLIPTDHGTQAAWARRFIDADVREWEKQTTYSDRSRAQEFDYGYALTCHSAQGSEWPDVAVTDESWCWRRNGESEVSRWQYTAVTRAKNSLVVREG